MKLPRAPEAGLRLAGDAWRRCAFDGCALIGDGVELMWSDPPAPATGAGEPATDPTQGLAFDRLGRALRSLGDHLETLPLAEQAEGLSLQAPPVWTLLPAVAGQGCGRIEPAHPPAPARPGLLAVSSPDLLWVAERDAARVWRYDLWGRRYFGALDLAGPVVGLSAEGADGDAVLALLRLPDGSGQLLRLSACTAPQALPWPAALRQASQLVVDANGGRWVLLDAGGATARLMQVPAGLQRDVPGATALATGGALHDVASPRLFVGRGRGQALRVFGLDGAEDREAAAPDWDGGALAGDGRGRVAYVAVVGGQPELRYLAPLRLPRARQGRVLSFRLDSEQPRAAWGRLWLEACLPPNTSLALRCLISDDDAPPLNEAPRTPPANQPGLSLADGFSPPLPDALDLDALHAAPAGLCIPCAAHGLRRDRTPWRAARPGHVWLEASSGGGQGRFLWVEVELRGDGLRSPVLRAVEAEQPGHAWLSQLPALFSREAQAADFLRRYLAAPAQLLGDLGLDADARHRLLSSSQAPTEMLDWLAGLLGLALQPAWSEAARRQLIAEAGRLAPRHGTPEVVRRIVEILAEAPVLLIEGFRLRTPGVIGSGEANTTAVLGAGLRLGTPPAANADIATVASQAWRFTLLVQGEADPDWLHMLSDAVERFKPAHTAFTICAVASGMRVGIGLHLDLAALVGPDSGLPLPVLGSTRLARDAMLGRSEGPAAKAASC